MSSGSRELNLHEAPQVLDDVAFGTRQDSIRLLQSPIPWSSRQGSVSVGEVQRFPVNIRASLKIFKPGNILRYMNMQTSMNIL